MLRVVMKGEAQYNNREEIAKSFIKRNIKKLYYAFMTFAYTFCGYFANQIATNSSWTDAHIRQLWRVPHKTTIM